LKDLSGLEALGGMVESSGKSELMDHCLSFENRNVQPSCLNKSYYKLIKKYYSAICHYINGLISSGEVACVL